MIKFSSSKQAFYDLTFSYENLPDDLIEIPPERHYELLEKINSGCIVFTDLSCSAPKPTEFHQWNGTDWVDNRTEEDKLSAHLAQFQPLTRRQFKLALLENSLIETVEQTIVAIEDPTLKTRIQIEYNESERFERTNQSVQYMLGFLNLTAKQVDEMWFYASTL